MKKVPVLLIAIACLFSCRQKDEPGPRGQNLCSVAQSRILKVGYLSPQTDTVWRTYSYNPAGAMISFQIDTKTEEVIQSDAQTVLIRNTGSSYVYHFDGSGKVDHYTVYIGSDTGNINERLFFYNSAGQLVKAVTKAGHKGGQYNMIVVDSSLYTWQNGNPVGQQYHRYTGEHDSIVYSYNPDISGRQFFANAPDMLRVFSLYFMNRPGVSAMLPVHALSKRVVYTNGHEASSETYAYVLDGAGRITSTTFTPRYILNPPPFTVKPHYQTYTYECN